MTRKSDKNQLEPGKGVGLSPKNISVGYSFNLLVLYENYPICIFMNINKHLKMRKKTLDKLVPQGIIRPTLNPYEHFMVQ